jgi:glycosyltransferase involved in cell wall biosynthesis
MDKKYPVFSVITVVYNNVFSIEDTIKSILSQKYENVQYVVIDGGSTDGTVEIINKYLSSIDVFKTSKDHGISDAFNKGYKYVNGDFIGIINSGDIMDPYALIKMATLIKNTTAPIDYIYASSILRDIQGNNIKTLMPNMGKFPYLGMPFQHSALYISKRVYEHVGLYNVNYKNCMDFELLIRIHRLGYKGKCIDQVVSYYYRGGVSDKNYRRGYLELFSILMVCENISLLKSLYYVLKGYIGTSLRKSNLSKFVYRE